MASAEREPITGVWGGAPSGVQGLRPPEALRRSLVDVSVCKVREPWLNGLTVRDEIWFAYSYGMDPTHIALI